MQPRNLLLVLNFSFLVSEVCAPPPSTHTPPFSLFWGVSWLSFDFYLVMIACGGVRVVSVELCYLSVFVSFSSVYFAYLYVLTIIRLGVRGCISASKCFDFECLSVVSGVSG